MVCPGTGLSPCRALVQQRPSALASDALGRMVVQHDLDAVESGRRDPVEWSYSYTTWSGSCRKRQALLVATSCDVLPFKNA